MIESREYPFLPVTFEVRDIHQARITCLGTEVILGRAVVDRFAITFDHGQRIIAAE